MGLIHLTMTRQGMMMAPWLVAFRQGEQMVFALSHDPEGEPYRQWVPNLETIRKLEDTMVHSGALGWGEFRKHKTYRFRRDGDKRYLLELQWSDGTKVTVDGYNASPEGFDTLWTQLVDLFQE